MGPLSTHRRLAELQRVQLLARLRQLSAAEVRIIVPAVAHAVATMGAAAAARRLRRLSPPFWCRASATAKSRDHESKQLELHIRDSLVEYLADV